MTRKSQRDQQQPAMPKFTRKKQQKGKTTVEQHVKRTLQEPLIRTTPMKVILRKFPVIIIKCQYRYVCYIEILTSVNCEHASALGPDAYTAHPNS